MRKSEIEMFSVEELRAIQSARNEINDADILYDTLDMLSFYLPEKQESEKIFSVREPMDEQKLSDDHYVYRYDTGSDDDDLLFYKHDTDYPIPGSRPHAKAQPQWYVGMTSRFVKDIEKYDRKIQGRILLTLSNIIENPITPKGDTVKPLMGDLKGLWRYRIGDFRLVYLPDPKKNVVTLLAFTGRGDIYESLRVA